MTYETHSGTTLSCDVFGNYFNDSLKNTKTSRPHCLATNWQHGQTINTNIQQKC